MRFLALSLLVSASAWAQDAHRFEVSVSAAAAYARSDSTGIYPTELQQFGADVRLAWWPRPGLGLALRGLWNAHATETTSWREFKVRARVWDPPPQPLDVRWGLLAGTDVSLGAGTLLIGSRATFFQVLIPAAFGAVQSDVLLMPERTSYDGTVIPASRGDAGWRLAGSVGLAMRIVVADRFAVRVELADLILPTRMTRVNGCDYDDLRAMDGGLRRGVSPDALANAYPSPSCRVDAFSGTDPVTQQPRANAVPLALNAVRVPTNSLMHLVSVRLGFGVSF